MDPNLQEKKINFLIHRIAEKSRYKLGKFLGGNWWGKGAVSAISRPNLDINIGAPGPEGRGLHRGL